MMTALYCLVAALAIAAGATSMRSPPGRFWLAVGLVLLGLGLARAFGAGEWAHSQVDGALKSAGWYADRRIIQLAIIAALLAAVVGGMLVARARVDGRNPRTWAAAGLLALLCFAVVRASSLHWTDLYLERRIGGFELSHLIQLLCLAIVIAAALIEIELKRGGRDRPG